MRNSFGVTFNDLDPPGTRISKSSEFSVVNITEIALNIGAYCTNSIFYESGDYR